MECNCIKEWKFADPKIDAGLLEPTFEKYVGVEGSLIAVLQKAQDLYGYLPVDLLAYISHRTGIKPSKVIGVVTFYTQFRMNPIGKHLILICQGTACHVNGSADVEAAIRGHIGVNEGEISEDGLFTYNNVACLGCCSLAPAIMIGDKVYGNLTREKTVSILEEIKNKEASE
ncbi:MAG: NAD(P)H-dependent oxidoreductase subunit E [Defluviitaleaceae bacterium]|nr:NAD(P)H-dependent oxidoreductase subunit E [Defluviitaleaceae bacterium]